MDPNAVNDMWKNLFAAQLGVRFVETGLDRVVAELEIRGSLLNIRGVVHGGALMALADTVGGTAAVLNLARARRRSNRRRISSPPGKAACCAPKRPRCTRGGARPCGRRA
jgi:acyl-coenzyme A thioesterase PaaI-like protein